RQCRRALRAQRRATGYRRRHREAALARLMPALRQSWLAALAATAFAVAVPALGADLNKTLRVVFPIAETGFDPQAGGDAYSNYVNRAIFDPLYSYDYLSRPYKIVPNTATALPDISADGKTWTIKLKHGLYFADDPV